MIRTLGFAAAMALAIGGLSAPVSAAACKDAKGKFTKCPVTTPAKRCKDDKGKFAKCGTPGAVPA